MESACSVQAVNANVLLLVASLLRVVARATGRQTHTELAPCWQS